MVVTKGTKKQDREVGRMSRRTAACLAWSVCAVCVALVVLTLSLDFFTDDRLTRSAFVFSRSPGLAFAVLTGMLSLVFPAVGAIIASRLPMNAIGWIFCGVGLLYTTQRFTQAYANYALLVNFAFPGGEYMAWFSGLVNQGSLVLELAPIGGLHMYQEPTRRLSDLSQRCHVRKFACLLARPLSGNLRDVAVPRRQSTISSVANRRVDGSLRSGVVRTLRCLLSAGCGYLCLRYEPVRMGRGDMGRSHRRRTHDLRFLELFSPHWRDAVIDVHPRCDLLACPSASPSKGR